MKELYKALLAAQMELTGVVKNAKNPYFKSDYADLKAVMDTVKPVFNSHGVFIQQTNNDDGEPGTITVVTELIHAESGESIASRLTLPLKDKTPQAAGSALTYARRYALACVAGLYQEDDDGNAASTPKAEAKPEPQQIQAKSAKKQLQDIFIAGKPDGTQYQIAEFQRLIGLDSIDKSTEEQCQQALQRYQSIVKGAVNVK